MREINIKFIPHEEQRYSTCGNYWKDKNGNIQIRVSILNNKNMENLVALHELVECLLIYERNIPEESITLFDIAFDESGSLGEPGDSKESPYRKEHFFATSLERLMAGELNVDWNDYEHYIMKLFGDKDER